MPQKPQVRAKDKRRLTKRLAAWRKKQEEQATTAPKATRPAQAGQAPARPRPAPSK